MTPPRSTSAQQGMPPVAALATAVLALVVIGGIYLAAHLPTPAPLGPAVALLCAAAAVLVVMLIALARLRWPGPASSWWAATRCLPTW